MDARRSQSSTDGRRRRLLATQDTEELLAEFEALAPQAPVAAAPDATISAPDRPILQRIISGQMWKHAVLILVLTLVTGVSIWFEYRPSGAVRSLGTSGALRITHGLSGILLLTAGQLALLIGWIRSHSTVDFSGRYRCWKWLAGCLFFAGIFWITNLQDSLPQLARLLAEPIIGSIGAARRTLVVVPISAISIWVLSRIVPDMGRNRWSQAVFVLGVLIAAARLLPAEAAASAVLSLPALNGLLMSATTLIVSALLLHARFVLYVSKDPPERRASRAKPAAGKVSDDSQSSDEKSAAEPTRASKKTAKTSAPEPPVQDTDDTPDVIPAEWSDEASPVGEPAVDSGGTAKERKRRRGKRRGRKAA